MYKIFIYSSSTRTCFYFCSSINASLVCELCLFSEQLAAELLISFYPQLCVCFAYLLLICPFLANFRFIVLPISSIKRFWLKGQESNQFRPQFVAGTKELYKRPLVADLNASNAWLEQKQMHCVNLFWDLKSSFSPPHFLSLQVLKLNGCCVLWKLITAIEIVLLFYSTTCQSLTMSRKAFLFILNEQSIHLRKENKELF